MSFVITRSSHPWEQLLHATTQTEIDTQVNEIVTLIRTPLVDLCPCNRQFVQECGEIFQRLFPLFSRHFSLKIDLQYQTMPEIIYVQRICIKTSQTEHRACILSLAVAIVKSALTTQRSPIVRIEGAENALSRILLSQIGLAFELRLEKINRWVGQHPFPLERAEEEEKLKRHVEKLSGFISSIENLREDAPSEVLAALPLNRLDAANELLSKLKAEMERLGLTT